jgi:two-component system, chemotaxis family, protein-glutamate methylesterase/glutaminase
VVADSRSRTRALRGMLTAGPGFHVAEEACTAEDAEAAVVTHRPGVVLLDLDAEAGGLEAIERIMGTRPTPIVVSGTLVEQSQAALAAGAVDVVGALDALPTSPQYATALRRHLRVASRVRVITHPRNRLRTRGLAAAGLAEVVPLPGVALDPPSDLDVPAQPSHSDLPGAVASARTARETTTAARSALSQPRSTAPTAGPAAAPDVPHSVPPGPRRPEPPAPRRADPPQSDVGPGVGQHIRVVVIGASTGGPPALATILADLPADLPVPILVVQHMADGFVEGLASWLDTLSPLPVMLAQHGRRLQPGVVHVAPARLNTIIRPGLRVELRPPPEGQFHVPGVDASFASTAAVCGREAIGVLLTGMGRDGAEGLRRMRGAGAYTIGQDEPTSVVWGMPAAAQALGAVEVELPLSEIAGALTAVVTAAEAAGR